MRSARRTRVRSSAAAAAVLACATAPLVGATPQSVALEPAAAADWVAAAAGPVPVAAQWSTGELTPYRSLEPCTVAQNQAADAYSLIIGRLASGNMDEALQIIGGISRYRGLEYWSITDGRRETLIEDSFAVDGPELAARRADFAPSEMRSGRWLYFAQRDNRLAGPVLYRMRVLVRSPRDIIVESENATPIKFRRVTLFEVGNLHTLVRLSTTAEGGAAGYALMCSRGTWPAAIVDGRKSRLNRLVALWSRLAGSEDSMLPWAR